MSSSVLAYAFLRTFYNRGVQSPLDALVPLVKRALMDGKQRKIDQQRIQKSIRERTGLEIPINVIRYTFPLLSREGILEFDKNSFTYHLRSQSYVDEEVKRLEQAARETYNRLVSNSRAIIISENSKDFDADELIEYWLDTSALSFLGSINPAYNAGRKDREANRLIAIALNDSNFGQSFLADLTDVAMGDCLYRAIKGITEYEVHNESDEGAVAEIGALFRKKMNRVDVYFDTRFILRAIGFVNEEFKKATDELINLCQATGARLLVFDHTVEEVQRIIESVASRLRYSQEVEGDIADYAYQNGLESGDLVDLAAQIIEKIEGAGFEVRSAPPLTVDLSVNERALDERLRIDLKQESDLARITDIRSLTAIFRLRGGESKQYLEDCNAIFVTTNKGLADSSVRFFREHFERNFPRNRVQICVTDVVFATRLWTKLPTNFDRLPRQQIVAHVLGNLRPTAKMKDAFVRQLRELVNNGKLSEEGAARLRLSRFANEIMAIEFESNKNDLSTAEAVSVANKIIAKQKELWEKIKNDAENSARKLAREEINILSDDLEKISTDLIIKNVELEKLSGEIDGRRREIELLEAKEYRVRQKIKRFAPWITRVVGLVCLFWIFDVFFGMVPSVASMLDTVGLTEVGGFARSLGSWSERISAAVMGFLTLGGFSLVGLQEKIERWFVRKVIEFLFE